LILEDLASSLKLPHCKLYKPIPVGLALVGKAGPVDTWTDYVKLKLYNPNNLWASHVVHAVVAPSLCTDILLRLPFLSINKLVCDYNARTCVDKKLDFDILHPVAPPPHAPPKPKLKDPYAKIIDDRREMLADLGNVCAARLKTLEEQLEKVRKFNVLGMVHTWIEQLAFEEGLHHLDEAVKEEYTNVFKPIPHINRLPTVVYCHISLRDANKSVSTRSYACPCKYRDTWKTLLHQHLETGCIRPSASTHASPSFIIPKANATVLPCWVNDYRQLNVNTIHDRHPLLRIDDILANCTKGKIWSVIDTTNSFFETLVHLDDIEKTAARSAHSWVLSVTSPCSCQNWHHSLLS
jgi:hypothetical protein